jgi:hypothetical protein
MKVIDTLSNAFVVNFKKVKGFISIFLFFLWTIFSLFWYYIQTKLQTQETPREKGVNHWIGQSCISRQPNKFRKIKHLMIITVKDAGSEKKSGTCTFFSRPSGAISFI